MVNSSKTDDIRFDEKYNNTVDNIDKISPKYKACSFLIFPDGIGRKQVLLINASRSDSYHMFNAPAAPEPIATANKETIELVRDMLEGEIIKPTMHVNNTSDMTLGFIKLKKECKLMASLIFASLDFVNTWLNLFYFRQFFKSVKWWW